MTSTKLLWLWLRLPAPAIRFVSFISQIGIEITMPVALANVEIPSKWNNNIYLINKTASHIYTLHKQKAIFQPNAIFCLTLAGESCVLWCTHFLCRLWLEMNIWSVTTHFLFNLYKSSLIHPFHSHMYATLKFSTCKILFSSNGTVNGIE